MSAVGRTAGLYVHAVSPIHRTRAHVKVATLLGFMIVVVATPATWGWAFAGYFGACLAILAIARVPLAHLARLLVFEFPFLVFVALMPFVATGPRVEFLGIAVSAAGLLGAWATFAKGTVGILAALALAATTTPPELLAALRTLRMPTQLVQIMGFMLRYLSIVVEEFALMRIARESRGFRARSVGSWPAIARASGTMFLRSYARSERVHLAMLARGYEPTR